MTKTKVTIVSILMMFTLSACWQGFENLKWPEMPKMVTSKTITVVPPKPKGSVVVCRQGQCQTIRNYMTPEFVNNIVFNLFNNNMGSDVEICEADPSTRNCVSDDLRFSMVAGAGSAVASIPSARVIETRLRPQGKVVDIALDYNLFVNGVRPHCVPSRTAAIVKSNAYLNLESAGFYCQINGQDKSSLTFLQAVDHIDLDYGVIGASYSIGMSGSAYGGGSGYMVMRFRNNVHTINPHIPAEPGLYNPNKLEIPEMHVPEQTQNMQQNMGQGYPATPMPVAPATRLQSMPVPSQAAPSASAGKPLPLGDIEVIPLPSE
jgi:hypothetical protein